MTSWIGYPLRSASSGTASRRIISKQTIPEDPARRLRPSERARFLGQLAVGTGDLTPDELRRHYDAVIYATGAQSERNLSVPGDFGQSLSRREFVSWYSGHPLAERAFDLSAVESVAVIGAGNVALDVARLLAKHPDELRHTDVPDDVRSNPSGRAQSRTSTS